MSGYATESYENGARFAKAVARNYGIRAAAREVLDGYNAAEPRDKNGSVTPHGAWLQGALDTILGLTLDAKADGRQV